ncbi:DUF6160 family protein [Thalassolituus marinus]|uniref:DUF6160 domain-containing protein n=1 Tax=Thalassolituus marinus TaxID=671053 RepID=A0ABS7ZU27_9GAMM|nr:DUF6160 family protein [Thalassolituus marinus]MCA6064643.1 hypothetical protein [Thalassolituus marinus]
MNKTLLSVAVIQAAVASSAQAMQVLDDSDMASVSGQSGITIEVTTNDANGEMLTTGEIRYTEEDKDGQGADNLTIDGMSLRTITTDADGVMTGVDTIRTTIDVDDQGNVHIRQSDIDTLELEFGEIALSGRSLFGGVRLSVWKFIGDSYLETVLLNDPAGSKIGFVTAMEEGSGLTYQFDEDGLTFSTDIVFLPKIGETTFRSEVFLTGDTDELKLEIGETSGSLEIRNISLLNDKGENIFGANNFGDLGYGDITVNTGYFTIAANQDPDVDGIAGRINSDLTVGNVFYRTGDQRLNLNNVNLNTNGEIDYTLDFIDTGFTTGIDTRISNVSDLDLTIGAITLSSGDGSNESLSMGSYAIENLNLNGDSIDMQMYTLPGVGAQGLQMDLTMAGTTSFDLTIKDDPAENAGDPDPQLTASVVLNNVSVSQTIDQTEKGLHVGVLNQSMDVNINQIRMGDGLIQQGQTGRLVMNNVSLQPGSYFRVEPLQ